MRSEYTQKLSFRKPLPVPSAPDSPVLPHRRSAPPSFTPQHFRVASEEKDGYIARLQEKMSDLNKSIGVGRLTADPKSQATTGAGPITTFTIAVNERRHPPAQGNSTTFVPIFTMGHLAESCAQFLRKGRQVLVEGKLYLEPYEDEAHGKHVRASVKAETIQFLAHSAGSEKAGEASVGDTRLEGERR